MSKFDVHDKRGHYSTKLRTHLKNNYVQVPALSQKVSLYDYLKLARNSYYNAVNSYKKNNVQGAYVEFHKFQILVLERLPAHKDFNSNSKHAVEIRKWIKAARESAMTYLEFTVDKLDEDEYRTLYNKECKSDLDLIDEFDTIEEPATVHQAQTVLVSSDETSRSTLDSTRFNSLINDCDKSVVNNSAQLPHLSLTACPSVVPDIDYATDDLGPGGGDVDCDISQYEEHALAGLSGLSNTDTEILCTLRDYREIGRAHV